MLSSPSIEVALGYQLSRGEHAIPRPAVKQKNAQTVQACSPVTRNVVREIYRYLLTLICNKNKPR